VPKASTGMKPADFAAVYDRFQATVSRYDCGRFCAPLNKGEPVCCSTQHAVPVVDNAEFKLLKTRSDLWHRFKPYDAATRRIVDELHPTCSAIECKGARHCERDNRSIACRAFPFYPYMTREGAFVGLGTYWTYEDRCWLISNMKVVEREFVKEFVAAYEYIFERDPDEYNTMKSHSAAHRRTFSRRGQPIPLIGRDGGYLQVLPKSGKVVKLPAGELPRFGAYVSRAAYGTAAKRAGWDAALPPVPI
jgi:hypothetical protein